MQPAAGHGRRYSLMLIASISCDNCCITKASVNAQQLAAGVLLSVGGQNIILHKTHKHSKGTVLSNYTLIRANHVLSSQIKITNSHHQLAQTTSVKLV